MLGAPVDGLMRWRRRGSSGLSEIVGTLMLVLITVTAATLFAAFVSTYEKQVLSEESQKHDRSLETAQVSGIQLCSALTCPKFYDGGYLPSGSEVESVVNVTFVSGDVNPMYFYDYQVNGEPAEGWLFLPYDNVPHWMEDPAVDPSGWPGCQSINTLGSLQVGPNASCSEVAPYGQVNVSLILLTPVAPPIRLEVFTALSDEFSYLFFPPVPIVKVTELPIGSETIPLFDGSSSYEPVGGDNSSIDSYVWTVVNKSDSASLGPYAGPQVEIPALALVPASNSTLYNVTLTVTNTDGLSASTTVGFDT